MKSGSGSALGTNNGERSIQDMEQKQKEYGDKTIPKEHEDRALKQEEGVVFFMLMQRGTIRMRSLLLFVTIANFIVCDAGGFSLWAVLPRTTSFL
jgi:hypothetical protein